MKVAYTRASLRPGKTYYDKLHAALSELGYIVEPMALDAENFGVPQRRKRLVVIGIRSDVAKRLPLGITGVFERINASGAEQLRMLGGGHAVTAEQAISDLVVNSNLRNARTVEYTRSGNRRGYTQLEYDRPSKSSDYQQFMNAGVARDQMDSMRLARHTKVVRDRFKKILARSRRGVNLSEEDRTRLGMLKHRTVPMSKSKPAPTLTTLPDDILHYSDPRILTVRESARLQSFPDWFTFHGKYTTGGDRRKVECPRYTQVGNAVPPLLARAIGSGILEACGCAPAALQAHHTVASKGKKILFKKATVR
jgi:DNA (cytosine-5)-methyltransferase 1